jgi:hypothetical protein
MHSSVSQGQGSPEQAEQIVLEVIGRNVTIVIRRGQTGGER